MVRIKFLEVGAQSKEYLEQVLNEITKMTIKCFAQV
jgi:hypothetical protein